MRIDPHVHFRDEEQSYKETIIHGLKTAKEQGIDIVFDMPNTAKPILRIADVKRRLALVPPESRNAYRLYIGATKDDHQLQEAATAVQDIEEVIGIKMFAGKSTGTLEITNEQDQQHVFDVLTKIGFEGVIGVHCEKESCMTPTFDPARPISHAQSRPARAEVESIRDQIMFVKKSGFKGTLHILHVSCKESVELIAEARETIHITCGVTPHHLIWTEEKMNEDNGLLYKMNPPLRKKNDVEYLRQALKDGRIDWIETDHAPHTIGEKLYAGFPSGYPSLYLYKDLIDHWLPAWGLSAKRIEEVTSANIVRTFKLNLNR